MEQLPKTAKARLAATRPGPHLDAEQLNAFAENALGDAERETVLAHLGTCADCRDIISLSAAARPADAAAMKPARGGFRWATFQWAAVAASVAIVTIAVVVVGPKQPKVEQRAMETVARKQEPAVPPAAEATSNDAVKQQATPRRDRSAKLDNGAAGDGSSAGRSSTSGDTGVENQHVPDGVNITDGGFGGIGVYSRTYPSKSSKQVVSPGYDEKIENSGAGAPATAASAPAVAEKKQESDDASKRRDAASLFYASPGVTQGDTFHSSVPATQPVQVPAPANSPAAQISANAKDVETAGAEQRDSSNQLSKEDQKVASSTNHSSDSGQAGRAGIAAETVELSTKAEPKPKAPAGASGQAFGRSTGGIVAVNGLTSTPIQWRIASGRVESSADNGASWQVRSPVNGIPLTTVAASGAEVFAGGKAGTLLVSRDGGQSWGGVALTGTVLPFEVTQIKITSPEVVDVILSNGYDFQSNDGGKSFRLLPQKP